ncbi:hypothetical protein IM543_14715 [Massilia sp. UMI-21]|nr:hypothetical protein IM543_14715 [Massilia sp. UMI-21]
MKNNSSNNIDQWISDLKSQIDGLWTLLSQNTPKNIQGRLRSVEHYLEIVQTEHSKPDTIESDLLRHILTVIDRAHKLYELAQLTSNNTQIQVATQDLYEVANDITEWLDTSRPKNNEPVLSTISTETQKLSAGLDIMRSQFLGIQKDANKTRQLVEETKRQASETSALISSYEDQLNASLTEASQSTRQIVEELLEKQKDVDNLVGLVSGKAIAGSYSKSAEQERTMANSMRNASVGLMLLIVGIIAYSLFEMAKPDFKWQTSILRFFFSLALSVPAAYLARESAKHREQHYSHLRISLDLQAITPYLASLPPDEQNKLKIDVANKIFGAAHVNSQTTDSYPLNLNELVLALISKLPSTKPEAQK